MPSPYDTPRRVNPAGRGLGRCGPIDGSDPGQHPFCRSRARMRDRRRDLPAGRVAARGKSGHEDRGGGTRPREAPITFLREEPAISQRQSPTRPDRILFCAAVTGADYALRSPSVRRYGYGTPQSLRWLGDRGRKGPPSTRYRHPYSPSTTYLIAADPDVARAGQACIFMQFYAHHCAATIVAQRDTGGLQDTATTASAMY
jgi:hypothetical protein